MSFHILGTGSFAPQFTVDNNQMAQLVDTSDEWITTRTGIKKRHIITTESVTEMALASAKRALEDAQVDAAELDLIIGTASLQADYLTPSLACFVEGGVGAKCPAFDVNAACSSFLYALDIAASYCAAGKAKKILVVAAEALSRHIDWSDRRTCVLFGDASGAVVLEAGEGLLASRITSDCRPEVLHCQVPSVTSPFHDGVAQEHFVEMNGQEVYKFAVSSVARNLRYVTEKAGIDAHDIDMFLLHQANQRIIDSIRERLGESEEKFPCNIAEYGNTSSASVPVLLDELNRAGRLKNGDILFMTAFGAGLTTGTCLLKWYK